MSHGCRVPTVGLISPGEFPPRTDQDKTHSHLIKMWDPVIAESERISFTVYLLS